VAATALIDLPDSPAAMSSLLATDGYAEPPELGMDGLSADDDAANELARLPRALTVAPPRISVSPDRATGAVIDGDGPPMSASAFKSLRDRLKSGSAGRQAGGDTAFAAAAAAWLGEQPPSIGISPPPSVTGGLLAMPDNESRPGTMERRTRHVAAPRQQEVRQPFAEFGEGTVSERLDALVDRVVERIEERVVDELERRGRRHSRGVF
jgi:hypothetical protein